VVRSRTGYRRDVVLIDEQVIALRDASGRRAEDLAPTFRYRGLARYLFIRCEEDAFVFVPTALAGARGRDGLLDPRFRNSFAAFADEPAQAPVGRPAGEPGPPIR
jgi:hypothetical protein